MIYEHVDRRWRNAIVWEAFGLRDGALAAQPTGCVGFAAISRCVLGDHINRALRFKSHPTNARSTTAAYDASALAVVSEVVSPAGDPSQIDAGETVRNVTRAPLSSYATILSGFSESVSRIGGMVFSAASVPGSQANAIVSFHLAKLYR